MAFNESLFNEFQSFVYKDLSPEETVGFYTKSAKHYDEICDLEGYRASEIAVNGFVELKLAKSIRILDVGAGQVGLVDY